MSFFESSLALVAVILLALFAGLAVRGWLTLEILSDPYPDPSSPNADMLPALAAVLAWKPPDPEIHVLVTACSCGCKKLNITVESAWGAHAAIRADAGTTMEVLRSTLELAGSQVLSHAPNFRIKEPVFDFKEN